MVADLPHLYRGLVVIIMLFFFCENFAEIIEMIVFSCFKVIKGVEFIFVIKIAISITSNKSCCWILAKLSSESVNFLDYSLLSLEILRIKNNQNSQPFFYQKLT